MRWPLEVNVRPGQRTQWVGAVSALALALCVCVFAQVTDVIIVAGSHTFHLKGCPQISGYGDSYLRSVGRSSLDSSYTACPVCRPDSQRPAPATPVTQADVDELWSRNDPAESVTIVTGPRTTGLFHRRGCYWLLDGGLQSFTRKDAESRYFQPHHECMRKPPDTNTRPSSAAPTAAAPAARPLVGSSGSAPVERAPSPTLRDTERRQCAAITKKGTRCSRMAQPGRAYCWQHP